MFKVKRDKKGKTGRRGGKAIQYDEADLIILEIIGKDSPLLEGLGIPESGTNLGLSFQPSVEAEYVNSTIMLTPNPISASQTPVSSSRIASSSSNADSHHTVSQTDDQRFHLAPKTFPKRKHTWREVDGNSALLSLKKTKLELQIKGLRLENCKRQLEILRAEKENNLPHSKDVIDFLKDNYANE